MFKTCGYLSDNLWLSGDSSTAFRGDIEVFHKAEMFSSSFTSVMAVVINRMFAGLTLLGLTFPHCPQALLLKKLIKTN